MLILFCKHCYEEVSKLGWFAEVIYEHINIHYIVNNECLCMTEEDIEEINDEHPTISILEEKGLIMTIETGIDYEGDHLIAIKPTGKLIQTSLGKYFCLGKHL